MKSLLDLLEKKKQAYGDEVTADSGYSQKEYNRYGWAVTNGLLSRKEMAVFQK